MTRALPAPKHLLELVNADLRGKITPVEATRLSEDPQRWLGILGAVLRNVLDQITERDHALEQELARLDRSALWPDLKRDHGAWIRRARHFEKLIRARIAQVRRLVPDDALQAVVQDGLALDPTDAAAVTDWQRRAAKCVARDASAEEG